MPEEPEVELEKLHEAIKEELEHEGGKFLKLISLTTAILAVLAALASLRAGATVNTALVLKAEATRLQSEASDSVVILPGKRNKSGGPGSFQHSMAGAWKGASIPV